MHLHIKGRPACLAGTALGIALVLAHSIPARGQSATMGGLSGTVAGAGGVPIAAATVHLVQEATGQVQTATTAANGSYVFTLLSPGAYEVQFAAHGFHTARMPGLVVSVAEAPAVDAVLEPGDAAEPVICQCRVSVTTSATSTVIDAKTITAVPLTTRNFT